MNQETMRDAGLLLMRIMLAVVFLYHGGPKLFGGLEGFAGYLASMGVPAPKVAAFLAAISEFGGGLVLLAGIGFRFALSPLAFTMLVASFTSHAGKFSLKDGGMEYALTLGVMVLVLILTGPGRFGIGRFLPDRKGD